MNGIFQARDGTPIYYEVRGKGKPLILCYGLLCRRDHWRHQIPYFEKKYQLILFDYRGHQRSAMPKNERNLTLDWCARDMQDLMNFMELDSVACMGHSVGVPVLTHLSLLEPKRVKANVFVCGSVNNPFQQMLFTDRLDTLFRFSAKVNEYAPAAANLLWKKFTGKHAFAHFMAAQLGFNPEVAESQDVEGYLQGVRETDPQVFYRLMNDYRNVDRLSLLPDIQTPTLVLAGDEDIITPFQVQETMAGLLPNGELVKIEGGSHNAHMDYPDVANEKIAGFLKKVGYR